MVVVDCNKNQFDCTSIFKNFMDRFRFEKSTLSTKTFRGFLAVFWGFLVQNFDIRDIFWMLVPDTYVKKEDVGDENSQYHNQHLKFVTKTSRHLHPSPTPVDSFVISSLKLACFQTYKISCIRWGIFHQHCLIHTV